MTLADRCPTVALYSSSRSDPTRERLDHVLARHPPRGYQLVGMSEAPDITLIVEYHAPPPVERLRQAFARTRSRYFIFSESDWPFAAVPGLYTSLERPNRWAHTWGYLFHDDTIATQPNEAPELLFSFVGRFSTHPCRAPVRLLDSLTSPCLDTTEAQARFPDRPWHYVTGYCQLMVNSSFVLCPRGYGASSMRIFEAMRLGRPPVIIADAWHPPSGPSWGDFSIRIAEKNVRFIPQILSQKRHGAQQMGLVAQREYQIYYAPSRFLDTVLDYCIHNFSPAHMPSSIQRVVRSVTTRELRTVASQVKRQLRR
jgi:hypothetical protein